jgi:hypothetical protein
MNKTDTKYKEILEANKQRYRKIVAEWRALPKETQIRMMLDYSMDYLKTIERKGYLQGYNK